MDIAEFLLARIAEDEAVALGATRNGWKVDPWRNASGVDFLVVADFDEGPPAFAIKNERDARHIARHDPARVLAECEGKRRIVEGFDCYITTRDAGWMVADVFKFLALPYADHPDYQPEWSPQVAV